MIPTPVSAAEAAGLVAVARGRAPADLVIRGGTVVNVYSEELLRADVAVKGGRIAAVTGDPAALLEPARVIDADGGYVLPGYLEPHCHPWMLNNPDTLARAMVPRGNTAFVAELLNLQLLLGAEQVAAVYRQLQRTPVRWYWAVRVAGQGNEPIEASFPVDGLETLLAQPGVVQIAEVTAWPRVLAGDTSLLARTALAGPHGLRLDGHTAGATPAKVAGLAAAGFTADHEPISYDEALARLRLGFHLILRHSSLRPDLDELVPLALAGHGTARMSVTADGSGPGWLLAEGMVDGLVRRLVRAGVPVPRAVAMGTLNPATYLRLDEHLGGVAPGRCADIQVLADFDGRPPDTVMIGGEVVAEAGRLTRPWDPWPWQDQLALGHGVDLAVAGDPASYQPPARPGEEVPVMNFASAGIARAGRAAAGPDGRPPGAVLAVLFSRDGSRRSSAWLGNFAPELDGLATTFNTSGGFLVIGRDPVSMATAARAAFTGPGGIAVASGTRVTAAVRLDIAGFMSSRPLDQVAREWQAVEDQVRLAGFPFQELLYCICFITCDFLPDLRLVADGLLEVKTGRILVPGQHLHR